MSWVRFLFSLVVVCTGIQADFHDVHELVTASASLISGTYEAPTNNDAYFENMTSSEAIEYGTFDFVIVGGGTAGLVLANRLTKADFSVLVVEAGREDQDVTAILGWFLYYISSNEYSWLYTSTPQKNACLSSNGTCAYSRGKVLGGSSSTNGGMYVRGNALDYDIWAELGNPGWSYDEVLPYFKKSESARFHDPIDNKYHGFDGLQGIDVPKDIPDLTTTILQALNEAGLEETDYNGRQQLGYSRVQSYLTKNIRSSSNYSYLSEIINRSNLNITLQSLVTNVIIENGTTTGVKFVKNGQYYIAHASKEVILSAGTIGTPQILMLSGIGPAADLNALNIEVIADLPVGKNFQDHMFLIGVTYESDAVIFNSTLEKLVESWTHNVGPLITATQTMAFLDLTNDSVPEVEIINAYTLSSGENSNLYCSNFLAVVSLLHPVSIGELSLASADPRDYPLINPNFLSDEKDIETIYQGIRFIESLNNTEALKDFRLSATSTPACDEFDYRSKDWWYCFIKHRAISGFHPVGTATMGPNPNSSVVNAELKVHGIKKLRVVDASVMPMVNSGHTNAPTVMIAEKSADNIILEYST